jgi:hypothetical protein
MTGSFLVTGSANIVGPLNATSVTSSFQGNIVGNITGSISGSTARFTSITGSLLGNVVGSFTGSISGSTAQFTSITSSISGSTAQFTSITASNLLVNGPTIISSSFTVVSGSGVEFQVTNTGVKIGNAITDTNTVTGSLSVSGSINASNFIGPFTGSISGSTSTFISSSATRIITTDFQVFNNLIQGNNSTNQTGSNVALFGNTNTARAIYSTLAGFQNETTVNGNNTFVAGRGNIADAQAQTVVGYFNISSSNVNDVFIVGGGTSGTRKNIAVFSTGSVIISGSLSISGSVNATNFTGSLFGTATSASFLNPLTQSVTILNNTPNSTALTLLGSGSFSAGSIFDFIRAQNTNAGVPTPFKFFRINSTGSFDIVNSAYDTVIFNLTDSGSLNITSNFTASNIWANSNGTGRNFAIGDDVWFGDINISNTTQLSGQQNPTQIYLKFASGSNTPTLWTTGSNTLNLSGSFTVNPSGGIELQVTNTGVTIGNAMADTHRVTGSLLITGSTHVSGDIKVGNIGTNPTPSGENTLSVYPSAAGGTGEGGQILLAASGGLYTSASMLDTYQNNFRILKGTNTGGSTNSYFNLDLQTGGIIATSVTSSFSGTLNGATIDSGSWISYTPTWTATTNPVIGDGTLTGAYKVIGKTCFVRGSILMGSSTTFGSGEWHIGLPFTASNADGIQLLVSILDAGAAWYNAQMNGGRAGFTNRAAVQYVNISNGTADSVSPTTPMTWASDDRIMWNGSYEIA